MQANIPSNTFVVSGQAETKHVFELLPGIVSQLSQEMMAKLSQLAGQQQGQAGMGSGSGVGATIPEEEEGEDGDDDDIPDLVENFEEAAAK